MIFLVAVAIFLGAAMIEHGLNNIAKAIARGTKQ